MALIESSGIDPRRIIIEVTETALMQDYEQVRSKIDLGFIRSIATQENARNIVKTVIDLKFDCVVEGVETAEQVEIINRLGCSTMQGYFFAKPMPQGEVETFIANYRTPDHRRMTAAAG